MAFFQVPQKRLVLDPSIIGSPDLLITESIEDAVAANAAGFPAVGFANNFRTDDNYLILIDTCTNSKQSYVVNTSGDTQRLGDLGIRLSKAGLSIFVTNIYDSVLKQFISLSEFMKNHGPEDFRTLIAGSISFTEILICQLPTNFMQASPALREHVLPDKL
jgi:hypothetical protein